MTDNLSKADLNARLATPLRPCFRLRAAGCPVSCHLDVARVGALPQWLHRPGQRRPTGSRRGDRDAQTNGICARNWRIGHSLVD